MRELWRPVVGYEGLYEVSDQGRVRSLDRSVRYGSKAWRRHHGTEIAPFRSPPTNYLTVSLSRDGYKRNRRIHVLVLEAFIGPRPSPEMDGCHNNSDPDDNRAANLRWDTKVSNSQDSVRIGTHHERNMTHCKRNHAFTVENTYVNPTSGARQCRQCVRDARGVRQTRPIRTL
ncbi:NUMOD4 domain-containing protein [Mycolicibacterium fluoranthenivorans]|uniref:NUMOD4 domain-containing protein n=1 Tax=Mycolicibacterium fluoranthenivorans TaxID=258505 RepID=UPI0014238EA9|nr:HNH endonuclease [Mycolicibacterium fluoranthenivorans]